MSYIGASPTSAAYVTDQFSGNGTTVAFTMSVAPANTSSMLVAITGVLQDPSTYSIVGTTLTFSAAPPTGTGNISVRYLGIPASGVTTTAYRTVTNFTATAGQTSFTTPSYTVGYINVFRNGVYLPTTDYTATTGTTVVLNNAATAGDTITTESFYVSSVLNAIPATAGSVSTAYLVDGSVTQAKLGTSVVGNGPAFSAYRGGPNQALTTATSTKVQLNFEEFDTNNNFDISTNYRFTPTVAGYYQISGAVGLNGTNTRIFCSIFKNGTEYFRGVDASVNLSQVNVSTLVYFNGSSDYVELYAYGVFAGTSDIASGQKYTYLTGAMVRSA